MGQATTKKIFKKDCCAKLRKNTCGKAKKRLRTPVSQYSSSVIIFCVSADDSTSSADEDDYFLRQYFQLIFLRDEKRNLVKGRT